MASITLLAGLYIAWLVSSVVLLATDHPGWRWVWFDALGRNPASGHTYDVLFGVVFTIAGGALSTVGWLAWRYNRVRWSYQRHARMQPAKLVGTGSITTDKVVGRDQLCDALMRDLSSTKSRRPHVVVGAVGLGKTALLIRLTQQLVSKGAVPVPIQLRTVTEPENLDFEELARKAFCSTIQSKLVSANEGEKVWRRLRKLNDRVVVLADGLEETLKDVEDRDAHIRRALTEAEDGRLPLVIASRPHAALRGLNAALTQLEPLNPDDAAGYITERSTWRGQADKQQVDAVVEAVIEAAAVTESPLYLQIVRQLQEHELLQDILAGNGHVTVAPRDRERWCVRYDLLERWVEALEDGWLAPELPLSPTERKAAVEYASALACVGLLNDCAQVKFEELANHRKEYGEELDDVWRLSWANYALERRVAAHMGVQGRGAGASHAPLPALLPMAAQAQPTANGEVLATPANEEIRRNLEARLQREASSHDKAARVRIDARVAATWADQMGLVEVYGDHIRFEHTVLQAYLGSRYLPCLVENEPDKKTKSPAALGKSLRNPGRELIMALTLFSRHEKLVCKCQPRKPDDQCYFRKVSRLLMREAKTAVDRATEEAADGSGSARLEDPNERQRKGLEMFAAALEIDSFDMDPQHEDFVRTIRRAWRDLQSSEQEKLEQTKIDLVRRIGASSRLVVDAQKRGGYCSLAGMACAERSYSVRYAIGQEIGAGGDAAFYEVYNKVLDPALATAPKLKPKPKLGVSVSQVSGSTSAPVAAGGTGTNQFPFNPVNGDRIRQKAARNLIRAHADEERRAALAERSGLEGDKRLRILRAWLIPLLVESCDFGDEEKTKGSDGSEISTPRTLLRLSVSTLSDDPSGGQADLELQLALAQGFKQAANRRRSRQNAGKTREWLAEQAIELLGKSGFWFTRLTLLHALALWHVRENVFEEQPMRGHGSSARKLVRNWLAHKPAGTGPEHPLVAAAGKSARRALQTCRPDHFLWIDETSVISKVGAQTRLPRDPRQGLWIAPSTGWSTLEPSAQQLLADVLVIAALTDERGDNPTEVQDRLLRTDQRNGNNSRESLPPCLVAHRSCLAPRSPAVLAKKPGSNCVDDCKFRLCPYPSKGPECRVEFSETFCIQQRSLYDTLRPAAWARLQFRRRGPWQRHMPVAELRQFWNDMADRARNIPLEPGTVRTSEARESTGPST